MARGVARPQDPIAERHEQRSVTMRNMFLPAVFAVACLGLSTDATATVVTMHSLFWVQIGPKGELLVTGTMGSMLSVDGGQSWTPPAGTRGWYESRTAAESVEQLAKEHHLTWPRLPGHDMPGSVVDAHGRSYRCSTDHVRIEYSDNLGADWIIAERLTSEAGRVLIRGGVTMISDKSGNYRVARSQHDLVPMGFGSDQCSRVIMVADTPYVLGRDRIYRSDDRGQHWVENYHSFGRGTGYYGALLGDSKGVLYINDVGPLVRSDGRIKIHRSKDRAATWEAVFFDLPAEQATGDVELMRVDGDALYIATQANVAYAPVSVYRSTDGRTAIKLLDIPDTTLHYLGLKFLDIGPQGELAAVGGQRLFLSTDRGKTWKTIGKDMLWKGPWSFHS
jgi:hypothetical protein